MKPGTRWAAASIGIAALTLAAFGYFLYSGSVQPTQCGTVPCSGASMLRAANGSVSALSDYLLGVASLLVGQVALAGIWLVKRRGP